MKNEFTISAQFNDNTQNIEELEKKLKNFCEEILIKLPSIWVYSVFDWDWNEMNFSEFLDKNSLNFLAFIWKKENWKIKFYNWKYNILGILR